MDILSQKDIAGILCTIIFLFSMLISSHSLLIFSIITQDLTRVTAPMNDHLRPMNDQVT